MVFNVRRAEHLELELSEDDVAEPPQEPPQPADDSSIDEPRPRHSGVGYRAEVLVVSFPLFSCFFKFFVVRGVEMLGCCAG